MTTTYDAGGQVQSAQLTAYYFGGAYEVRGSQVIKYYSFAGQTIAMRNANGLQYFLTDHLGSVVAVTDANGTLTSQQRYLPFGAVRELLNYPTTELTTDFGYTGQRDLGDMGLMDYRARFYSPYLNRFIQPDSLIPSPANPQAFNRYSYVANRPVNFNDPTGHAWDDCGERTGYACKIHMKQVGILKAQWKKEEAVAAAAREAAIADAMARIEGLDPGIIPSGASGVGGSSGCREDDDLCWLKNRDADNSQPTIPINPIQTPQTLAPPVDSVSSPESEIDWNKVVEGVVLLTAIILLVDFPLVIGLFAIPEFEATMIIDAVATGIPLIAILHDAHVYAINLTIEGYTGQSEYYDLWLAP